MKYKCKTCEKIYDTRQKALCCHNDSEKIFECSKCQDTWEYFWQANDCCMDSKIEEVDDEI